MFDDMTLERFWSKVDKASDANGCWLWKDALSNGYGVFNVARKAYRAHRFSYTFQVGEIPRGLVLDHLCRNRGCVNPAHLEPVTDRTNILRGISPAATNVLKTHCKHGHLFDEKNTVIWYGCRECVTCRRRIKKVSLQRRRARAKLERIARQAIEGSAKA